MFTVTVTTKDAVFTRRYTDKISADKILADVGIAMIKPCGGNGICGKCTITVNGKTVCACKTYIDSDSTIYYTAKSSVIQGVTYGVTPEFEKAPLIDEGFGVAIDVGTTTVAGYVYKFPECVPVKSICVPNTQAEFGADVISRIDFFAKDGADRLKQAVCDVIDQIADGFDIKKYVICGNTTMLYLLTGEDPSSLAVAPYHAERLFGEWEGNNYLVRCISAFVGSDVTSAILACRLDEQDSAMLVDIGTNGEMVLKSNGKMLSCSTAAGPCFEGAGITCGTPAVSGAINSVFIKDGKVEFSTIDDKTPIGLCGTGLIDAIAALLELGIIDNTGYMEDRFCFGTSDVYLSPEDVRKFQLAKSAIRSGIDTLLDQADVKYEQIDTFFIAGGFGSFLNIKSAVAVGLIPADLAEKVRVIGNGAGVGASMILQSRYCLEKSKSIADSIETVTLNNSCFMEKYVDNMFFES